jgi:hypothetical protein
MSMVIIAVAVVVVAIVFWFVWCASSNVAQKPPQFRDPIPAGQYRLVACDDMGGSEINRVIGDFPNFEAAQQEAAKGRKDSELQVGSKGSPTKFLIYDDRETFVGDWTGRKSAA